MELKKAIISFVLVVLFLNLNAISVSNLKLPKMKPYSFRLERSVVDLTHACSYYSLEFFYPVSESRLQSILESIEITRIRNEYGVLSNLSIEVEIEKNETKYKFVPVNYTNHTFFKRVPYITKKKVWKRFIHYKLLSKERKKYISSRFLKRTRNLDVVYRLKRSKLTVIKIRVCGEYKFDLVNGTAKVAIDHIPAVEGVEYRNYAWWNATWKYRVPITITENLGVSLTNYQQKLIINTSELIAQGKLNSDCSDLRFIDSDDATPLEYYIEGPCNDLYTVVWVKIPSLPASSSKTIYMYYGNPSATDAQVTSTAMFNFFDDFTNFDNTVWTEIGTVASYELYDTSGKGILHWIGATTGGWEQGAITTQLTVDGSHIIEVKMKVNNTYTYFALLGYSTSTTQITGNYVGAEYRYPDATPRWGIETPVGTTFCSGGGSTPPQDQWFILGLRRDSSNIYLIVDGATMLTCADTTYLSGYFGFTVTWATSSYIPNVWIDWIRVRIYYDTSYTIGAEEQYTTGGVFKIEKVEYNSLAYETTNQSFKIYIWYNSTNVSNIDAYLFYNDLNYSYDLKEDNSTHFIFTKYVEIPLADIDEQNNQFKWNIWINFTNGTIEEVNYSGVQTVKYAVFFDSFNFNNVAYEDSNESYQATVNHSVFNGNYSVYLIFDGVLYHMYNISYTTELATYEIYIRTPIIQANNTNLSLEYILEVQFKGDVKNRTHSTYQIIEFAYYIEDVRTNGEEFPEASTVTFNISVRKLVIRTVPLAVGVHVSPLTLIADICYYNPSTLIYENSTHAFFIYNYTTPVVGYENVQLNYSAGLLPNYSLTSSTCEVFNPREVKNGSFRVKPLLLDECNNFSNRVVNFYFRDEESLELLNVDVEVFINISNLDKTIIKPFSFSFNNVSNISICSNVNNTLLVKYAHIDYESTNYPKRSMFLFNEQTPVNKSLYLLDSSVGSYVSIQVKNLIGYPLSGYYVFARRYYTGNDTTKVVCAGITDAQGKVLLFLRPADTYYSFEVYSPEGSLVHGTQLSTVTSNELEVTVEQQQLIAVRRLPPYIHVNIYPVSYEIRGTEIVVTYSDEHCRIINAYGYIYNASCNITNTSEMDVIYNESLSGSCVVEFRKVINSSKYYPTCVFVEFIVYYNDNGTIRNHTIFRRYFTQPEGVGIQAAVRSLRLIIPPSVLGVILTLIAILVATAFVIKSLGVSIILFGLVLGFGAFVGLLSAQHWLAIMLVASGLYVFKRLSKL